MSKKDILTKKEFSSFFPDGYLLFHIENYRKSNGLKKEEINVLDCGCGKGREVLALRDRGYNAYGVDINPIPIKNGIPLIRAGGYSDSILQLANKGKTNFPDNFFHFIFSNQVFEHVKNIGSAVEEIYRITVPNGIGFHTYPADKFILEPHLLMPFIHYLPKNITRKYLIALFSALGIGPDWARLKKSNLKERINACYQYSIEKTYYRKLSEVISVLEGNGFFVNVESINSLWFENNTFKGEPVKYKTFRILLNRINQSENLQKKMFWFSNVKIIRAILNYILPRFAMVKMFIKKEN